MGLWSRRSTTFKFRAILIAFVPCAVVSTVASGIFAYYQADDIQERYQLTYSAEVQRLADKSAASLLSGRRDVLNAMCTDAANHRDIGLATILDEAGRIVTSARSRVDLGDTQRFHASISKLRVDAQGVIHNEAIGLAVIEASTKSIQRAQADLVKQCLFFVASCYAFGLALAIFISQNLTRPFKRISDTVTRIAEGDLSSRVRIAGDESVRGLAEGINFMAGRIQYAQNNLRKQVDEATEAMRIERDEARDVTLAKSRFVVAATHDLRQPMQALKLLSVELERRDLEDEERGIVSQMINSLSVVDQLIESFLDMSRLDAGAVHKNTSTFEPTWLFDRLKPELYRIASSKGIEIRFRPSKQQVTTDPMLFERILRNLISNAIRYTDSSIVVGTRYSKNGVVFEVRDNGPGISEEDYRRIFSDFVQLNNPERHQNKGLGMGLSIVKRLSKLLEISVSVRSKLGKGSVFSVTVPRVSSLATRSLTGMTTVLAKESPLNVILMSDSPEAFLNCSETLRNLGCETSFISTLDPTAEFSNTDCRMDFLLLHEDNFGPRSPSWSLILNLVKSSSTIPHAECACFIISGEAVDLSSLSDPSGSVIYIGPAMRASKVRSIIQRRRSHQEK